MEWDSGRIFQNPPFHFVGTDVLGSKHSRKKKHHEKTWKFTNGGLVRCAGSSSFVLDFHVPAISFLMEDWLDVLGPHHLCLIFINFPWEHVTNPNLSKYVTRCAICMPFHPKKHTKKLPIQAEFFWTIKVLYGCFRKIVVPPNHPF